MDMRKYVLSMAMAAILLVPGILLMAPAGSAETTASWTYAIYVAGDNSLENYWASTTLPFLQAVPPSDQVNLVAFKDLKTTSTIEIVKVSGSTVTVVETHPEMDSGSAAALTWWIDRATTLWPSTYFALMLWDHGFGWHYICSDDTSASSIDMPELQSAIANAGDTIDVLAMDACNMNMIEVGYQVSKTDLVQYMVASEEYEAGDGIPLTTVLTPLVNNPTMLPRDLSIVMVDAYAAHYTNTNGGKMTMASIDIPQLKATIGTFTAWSARMTYLLPTYEAYYAAAVKATHYMTAVPAFLDLYDLGYHLLATKGVTDTQLRTATADMQSSLLSYVVKCWGGPKMADCRGVSFYWATYNDWYYDEGAYRLMAFGADTGWADFIDAYHA
ncbi:MAG: clostripain-related cysteine peptidase [Candidatus Thermoplasmatota archaeon]